MAISDVADFAHLTAEQVEELGREFDQIRKEIEESRGADDAAYIRKIIGIQRKLIVSGRVALFASAFPPAWVAGTALLAAGTWEWDNTCPAEQWKHSHNYMHHTYTNVIGKDNDVGYGILRVTRDQKWHPVNLGQPVYNALLATLFEWGVALHDLDIESIRKREKDPVEMKRQLKQIWRKVRKQVAKDYVLFPALTGPQFVSTLTANATANIIRNLWSYMIIFCGHFPDGAEHFTEEELESETKAEWYLRQLLGSANFSGGRLLQVMGGSLGYQIEHHLYPDLPSNRYPEIAERVKVLCEKNGIPYTIGPLYKQYGQTLRTILKLSLPGKKGATDPQPPVRSSKRATSAELRNYAGPTAPQGAAA
jgi:linoleoyl-CoA desaturase